MLCGINAKKAKFKAFLDIRVDYFKDTLVLSFKQKSAYCSSIIGSLKPSNALR